ncbi:hypothetical protein GCM10017044_11010 [Kordiimonas sediminis]|uniref:Peptidase M15A C-terminal domain-containing protein n=1 Tax=Kordiimonas sediminis TaxID=1735581 RepID=A0A919E6X4_9PROT|nr:D-Ala-D-Ala carboxypeptidase family metallohydrolase [Kordiimonas sediminis]GHF18292.1 hypothetical protein GCM10017044_11010 [Kordiimonas sediminis]
MTYDPTYLLSPHFRKTEFARSKTAEKYGIDNSITEPHIIANLQALCSLVLEPIRTRCGRPVIISSGYRCEALNRAVGGARESQHTFGEAADFYVRGMPMEDLALTISHSDDIPFDQLIYEVRYRKNSTPVRWIHVSHKRHGRNRRECLTVSTACGQRQTVTGIQTPVYGDKGMTHHFRKISEGSHGNSFH